MKKNIVLFSVICFFAVQCLFAAGTYTYRTVEARSSQENPGVLDVTSTFEQKDENGEVTKDTKTQQVNMTDGYYTYRIKAGDSNNADVTVEPVSREEFEKENEEFFRIHEDMLKSFSKNFDDIRFDSFFDDNFTDDPFFRSKRRVFSHKNSPSSSFMGNSAREADVQERKNVRGEAEKNIRVNTGKRSRRNGFFGNLKKWVDYFCYAI